MAWACKEGLVITNTCFEKRWGLLWTHCQHGRKRQLDYVLVDKETFDIVDDATEQKRLGWAQITEPSKLCSSLSGHDVGVESSQ